MSVQYFTHDNKPLFKREYSAQATTAFAFWEATSRAVPVLTDYNIWVAAAGTAHIKFGRDASSSAVFYHLLAGSGYTHISLETPFVGDVPGGKLYLETGMNGLVFINATGFERQD